jgi:4-amino-4-deoxy-L-arabinose transferase-like glycosyltransferase
LAARQRRAPTSGEKGKALTYQPSFIFRARRQPSAEIAAGSPPEVARAAPADPAWTRPMLATLLIATAIAYLWNLSVNGWANSFYAAAVQAGTMSWKAFFFGSFDPSNYITVDKPPVSLWIMELFGRIFGFSSWTMLAPEALLGVASVALLFLSVRRVWGAPAGLLAGLALAVTPVATLMFRYNNPDAALTFFMVAAAYTMTRALERAGTRWLIATGLLMGAAFLTKELQALLVVPGLALAYLVAAPVGIGKRIGQLLLTGATMAVSGLWWMMLVDLIPASSRPYIGGSTDNSVLALALGFNGLGRLTGAESSGFGGGRGAGGSGRGGPGGPGGSGGGMFSGPAGIGRLFNAEFGGFIGWLIPAAIVGAVMVAWLTRRAGRTDARRASLLLWTGWFVVTAAVFSFSKGIIHTYYGISLAPAVAALAAMALPALWQARSRPEARGALAVAVAATAATAYLLLDRTPSWWPWVRWVILAAALLTALGLVVTAVQRRLGVRAMGILATVGIVSAVAAPAAWSAATIGSAHGGGVPGVGPTQAQSLGGGFGGGAGAFPGGAQPPGGMELPPGVSIEELRELRGGAGGPGGGGLGGQSETVAPALVTLLRAGSAGYTWAAAARSSDTAAPLQLSSERAVMSLGGFGGSDPAITLSTFEKYVVQHKVHYFVSGGGGLGGGGLGGGGFGGGAPGRGQRDNVSAIETWVTATFTAKTVGAHTVYDLSTTKTS